tara:strand:- start:141 stop:791 length:651 start_codon:yes stop_codon:yes gene_type:complete
MLNKIVIKDITFNHLSPLRKNFKNKNNKLSALGYYKNKKVKIYEVFDVKQGPLREFISKHKILSTYFPKMIVYDEKYIVEEWVEGKTLKEINIRNLKNIPQTQEVKKIIKLMWSINYNIKVFDYFDHIHKRIGKTNNFDLSKIPIRINHNDLSLDNIIISPEGLKIIDNEFLGCNSGWILNIINSFLKEDLTNEYFISTEIFAKLWEIRKEWSNYT